MDDVSSAMIYDMRTRGRPHPVYLIGGAFMLAVQAAACAREHDTMMVRDRGRSRAVQRLSGATGRPGIYLLQGGVIWFERA